MQAHPPICVFHSSIITNNLLCFVIIGYRIVIICDEKNENVISKLETYRRPYQSFESNEEFLTYLEDHFKNELDHELAEILDDDK